jgi:uncharacterized protein
MINRLNLNDIKLLLGVFPAVAIVGARQVGKTTTARQLGKLLSKDIIYFDLENSEDLLRFSDPSTLLRQYRDQCVVIDEVQRLPELFTALRPEIDAFRIPGRFLLLGSASPDLVRGVSETLAGRIAYFELHPLNIIEAIGKGIGQRHHWFRGGFPEPLLMKDHASFYQWMQHFISSYIERDLSVLFGVGYSRLVMKNLISMLAHAHGGLYNAEAYSRSLGVNKGTVNRYLEFIEGAYLVKRLPPWHMNIKKRLVKANRIYLTDSGLVHYLNRIGNPDDLQGHLISGASWEGYVIEQIRSVKPEDSDLYFYRTQNGAECDLLIVDGIRPLVAIEIKKSDIPDISKGFFSSIADLKTFENFVITPNSKTYIHKDIKVCSLIDFLMNELPRIKKQTSQIQSF